MKALFTHLTQKIVSWWSHSSTRERVLVGGGGGVALCICYYALLLSPMQEAALRAQNNLQYKRELQMWMQTHVRQLLQLRASAPSQHGQSAPAAITIERELSATALANFKPQIKQTSTSEIQVSFAEVPFDAALRWLGQLHQRFGIHVVSMNASRLGAGAQADAKDRAQGMVQLTVALKGR